MSAFLGPIHYWLFNKIQYIEDRAFAIADALSQNGKADAAKSIVDGYGEKLAGKDLAALVGDNSIHNFLYGLITKAELLEAQLMEAAGDDYQKALDIVEAHGKATGQKVVADKGEKAENLQAIYQHIADFHLEGMPCDPGAEVEMLDENRLAYKHVACNHMPNWEYTSCPSSRMCAAHNAWLKGFISGINESATYTVQSTIADGAPSCSAEIKLGG